MTKAFASEDMAKILLTEEEIQVRVKELAAQLSDDYRGKNPIMIAVLRGAILFFSDLVREMDVHVELNFLAISSYGSGTESTGDVRIQYDMQEKH